MSNKISAQLEISVNIECDGQIFDGEYNNDCTGVVDLFEVERFTDEGLIHKAVLDSEGFGCKDFNESVDCPECGKELLIGEITW